jgi:hypothetical protein
VNYLQGITAREWMFSTMMAYPGLVFFGYSPYREGMRKMLLGPVVES